MISKKYTLHTHTINFDGQDSVVEMVEQAKRLGFDTIGFSNHFIVNPLIKKSKLYYYSVIGKYNNIYSSSFKEANAKFKKHYDEIEKVRKLYPEMRILRGMEVDFFDDARWQKNFQKAVKVLKPDYIETSMKNNKSNG